jgi:hypothetical protein
MGMRADFGRVVGTKTAGGAVTISCCRCNLKLIEAVDIMFFDLIPH